MASVLESTHYKGLPKPHLGNQLSVDVERLRSALDMLDAYLHTQRARIPFQKADGTMTTLSAGITDGG